MCHYFVDFKAKDEIEYNENGETGSLLHEGQNKLSLFRKLCYAVGGM